MDTVLVGNLSTKGENLLSAYMQAYLPSAERVPLQKAGIRGKIKTIGKRPDTIMIIIDSVLYNECVDACADVLSLPKVHKYENDEGLSQFLIEKFGRLEQSEIEKPVNLITQDSPFNNSFMIDDEDDNLNFGSVESISDSIFNETSSIESTKTDNSEIETLRKENEQQKQLIDRLTSGGSGEDSTTIKTLADSIKKLKADIQEKEETIQRMEQEKYVALGKVTEADNVIEELKTIKEERKQLKDTVSELTYDKTKIEREKEDLEQKIDTLTSQQGDYEKLRGAYDKVKSNLDTAQVKLEATESELKKERGIKETIEQTLSSEKSRNIKLDGELAKAVEDNKTLTDKNTSLTEDVNRLTKLAKSKTSRVKELETELTTVKDSISEKDANIAELSTENTQYISKCATIKAELDGEKSENETLRQKINELEVESASLRTTSEAFNKYKTNTEDKLNDYEEQIQSKDAEIEELKASIDTMNDNQAASSRRMQEEYESCQAEIIQLRELNKDLESKVVNYDDMVAQVGQVPELKREVRTLKDKVTQLQNKSLTLEREHVKAGSKNDAMYKAKIEELEADKDVLQTTIDELTTGIYASIQNSALPKVKLSAQLNVGTQKIPNFYVFGSASAFSNMVAYQEMHKCVKNTKKKTLIVDLSCDSYIDSEFKPRGVNAPVGWLTGEASIDSFVAETEIPNVKVVSVGLSFVNTLYFLEVDWEKRLQELVGKFGNVIIYAGCMTDVVARILYQSLLQIMDGYLIVNATPVNLRTAILTLAGMCNIGDTNVCCVNLGAGSEVVYKRLSEKYKTLVWTDAKHFTI